MAKNTQVKQNRTHPSPDARTRHKRVSLSTNDWARFRDALTDPPEPNEKLKQAAQRYRERMGG